MSDVSKIFGPAGKPVPSEELKTIVNPEEFKKMMQQVQKTDPDEEKKRKQDQEETEEAPQEPVVTEPEYTEPKEGPSFLDVQKGSASAYKSQDPSVLEGKGYTPSAPSVYNPHSSVSDEIEPSLPETSPSVHSSSAYVNKNLETSELPSTAPKVPPVEKTVSTEENKEKPHATTVQPREPSSFSSENLASSVHSAPPLSALPEVVKPAPSLSELIAMMPPEGAMQELPPEAIEPEKVIASAPLQGILQPHVAPEIEKKPQKGVEEDLSFLDPSLSEMHAPIIAPPSELGANDPYSQLPTAIQELFTRMLGVITVMNLSPGVTETTFILNSPQFASSVFFGSQIIIKEFSTAPQVFNIQLNGSQQATSIFQSNLTNLAAAFQKGSPNFKVNRLETGYLQGQEEENSSPT